MCKIDIEIGTGGEANWNGHLTSKTHRQREALRPQNLISNFFQRTETSSRVTSAAAQPLPLSNTLPSPPRIFDHHATPPSAESSSQPVHFPSSALLNDIPETSHSAGNSPAFDLLAKIQLLAERLPEAVPIALSDNIIASFSRDLDLLLFDEPFEAMNSVLHSVFGYNETVDEISTIIHCRELGIHSLIKWFTRCMHTWGVTGGFLELRLERVHNVMLKL